MKLKVTKRQALFGLVGILGLLFILVELYLLSPGFRVICVAGGERVHAWDWLVNRLDDDAQDVRGAASEALIRGGPSAVPALIRGLDSSSASHRSLVAFTLGRIDPPATEAIPALKLRMQTDDDEPVRTAAAKALGLIGQDNPEVLADLMKLLETGDEPSRVGAAEAFGMMRKGETGYPSPDSRIERREIGGPGRGSRGPRSNGIERQDRNLRSHGSS